MKEEIMAVKKEVKELKKESFALEMLKDYKKQNKRLFIMWLITFVALISMTGYMFYLLNDIGTEEIIETETYEMEADNGVNNVIGGDNKYETAKGFCSVNNTIALSTRDIVDNMNANYRALHDEIVANRIEDKNAQITALQTRLNNAELRASQEAQSAYILNELKPCGKPAYIVPNPNCCYNYQVTQGCGCGC